MFISTGVEPVNHVIAQCVNHVSLDKIDAPTNRTRRYRAVGSARLRAVEAHTKRNQPNGDFFGF